MPCGGGLRQGEFPDNRIIARFQILRRGFDCVAHTKYFTCPIRAGVELS